MDPLTHTLTGLALSRSGLNRLSVHAAPVLLLAANAPDIDIVSLGWGSAAYLHYHRHLTHAFLMVPVLAILPLLVVRLFARKPFDWKWAYAVSFLGVLSHPVLDWMNAYGIRFLLPFSADWYRADTLSLPDIWIWLVLLIAALAPALSRLVSSEIGARKSTGRGWAVFALLFLVLYSFGHWVLHERAIAVLESRLYDGAAPVRVAAVPGPFNPFRWRGVVETQDAHLILPVDLLGQFDPSAGKMLYKAQASPAEAAAAEAARKTDAFRAFLDFSAYPLWRFGPSGASENAIRVDVMDLRFGDPGNPAFEASAVVDQHNRVLESGFDYRPSERQ